MSRRFTKFWHYAKIGTREPALCGKLPPGNREWYERPKEHPLPACPECAYIYEARRNHLYVERSTDGKVEQVDTPFRMLARSLHRIAKARGVRL